MTRTEVAALLDHRLTALARRDIAAVMQMHTADCIVESPLGGNATGHEAIRKVYEAWLAAFPDAEWAVEPPIVDGDRVAQATTVTGSDIGGFMGLPPTGKRFTLPIVFLLVVRDGRIHYERRIYDFTGLLIQLGVLKAKPA
ncbi:MAG TPA: ester cyclase [Vicinamibacterales bacterium]|jgi:steroid delta-isomerase-like uncharacterized protein|nr:ester cyclase [Vicinamibacterales bacterium]